MTDIEILEREKQCVQRKNCDRDCLRCDLLMSEEEILKAYDHAISALRAQVEEEKNEPLTLEEVRQMDGEPAWVAYNNDDDYAIVRSYNQNPEFATVQWFGRKTFFALSIENYGKTWLAYRRKPEERS